METKQGLVTTDIKGKAYVEVPQRIIFFRENKEEYPNGKILTEIVSLDETAVIFKASVFVNGELVSTGHAREKDGDGFINKTSFIENCETSAVGRALGNLGIGIDTSVASAEEVQNAIKQQEQPKPTKPSANYQPPSEEEMKQQGIEKGRAILEHALDKTEHKPTVLQKFLKKHGWNSMKDVTFKDNKEFKELQQEIKDYIQVEKDIAEAGI